MKSNEKWYEPECEIGPYISILCSLFRQFGWSWFHCKDGQPPTHEEMRQQIADHLTRARIGGYINTGRLIAERDVEDPNLIHLMLDIGHIRMMDMDP